MRHQIEDIEERLEKHEEWETEVNMFGWAAVLCCTAGFLIALAKVIDSHGTIGVGALVSTFIGLFVLVALMMARHRRGERLRSELRDLRMVQQYDRENR